MENDNGTFLVFAAGGNGTVIRVLDRALLREQYATLGADLGKQFEPQGAEQTGFLLTGAPHFEMAGGEFCGNGSRAAAALLSRFSGKEKFNFTVSGFAGTVTAKVRPEGDDKYFVRCSFPGMPTNRRSVQLHDGRNVDVVDLGGIVHVVIEGEFPSNPAMYEAEHESITDELDLRDHDAVGVTWFERINGEVKIHPVVWVKDVDTFFYETSCGSGTIATGKVTGMQSIVQPTGRLITAIIKGDDVVLESEMEVRDVSDDID